jgi:putative membrane protein
MSKIRQLSVIMLALAGVAVPGCSKHDEGPPPAAQAPAPDQTTGAEAERQVEQPIAPPVEEPPPPSSNEPSERGPEPEKPTQAPIADDQTVRILSTVDNGEIEQGQLAQTKADDARVKKFATQMIEQHTRSKQRNAQLAQREQLLPANSSVANDLTDEGTRVLDSLNRTEGPAFDQTYINAQVDQHQAVLDLLNSRLIPGATNPKLKAQLLDVKKMVEKHLEHAKEIQSESQR